MGINHFDTAPYYSMGVSEIELGKFIRNKKNITFTSKFGIYPKRFVKNFYGNLSYKIYKKVSNISDYYINFSKELAEKSLEGSLKRMNIDVLDYFFVHEPDITMINIYEIHDWLERQRQKGNIKFFGLAGQQKNISRILELDNSLWNIIQTNDGLETKNEIDEKELHKIKFRYGYFQNFKHDNSNIDGKCKEILSRNRSSSIIFSTRKKKNIDNLIKNFGFV